MGRGIARRDPTHVTPEVKLCMLSLFAASEVRRSSWVAGSWAGEGRGGGRWMKSGWDCRKAEADDGGRSVRKI